MYTTNSSAFVVSAYTPCFHCRYANDGTYKAAVRDFEKALTINHTHRNARKYLVETQVAYGKEYVSIELDCACASNIRIPLIRYLFICTLRESLATVRLVLNMYSMQLALIRRTFVRPPLFLYPPPDWRRGVRTRTP